MDINFPAVLFMRGALTVEDAESVRVVGMRFPNASSMIVRASAKKGYVEPPGWMLDSDGGFRDFVPKQLHRKWTASFSPLFQIVLVEFLVSDARQITGGELLEKLAGISDQFEEAPIADDLRLHVRKYPANEILSGQALKDWPI